MSQSSRLIWNKKRKKEEDKNDKLKLRFALPVIDDMNYLRYILRNC